MHSDGNGQKSLHAMYSGCGGKPFQVSVRISSTSPAAASAILSAHAGLAVLLLLLVLLALVL
jgi:hypothetical protein